MKRRSDEEIRIALETSLKSGTLPAKLKEQSQQAYNRITQPVRIAVMGLPKSGKTTLLNLLVGDTVIPIEAELPSYAIVRGETERAVCTLRDGSEKVFETIDIPEILAEGPVYISFEMDLPALEKISVLEVVMGPEVAHRRRAMAWAARRADIALWCSQEFTEDEFGLWTGMPDRIKDHAFLVVTKADLFAQDGSLEERLGRMADFASDDFHGIFPVATLQALDARAPDGSIDKARMVSSGGLPLISAILKVVELGRQSAFDKAEMLLRQSVEKTTPPTELPKELKELIAATSKRKRAEREAAEAAARGEEAPKLPKAKIVSADEPPAAEPVAQEAPREDKLRPETRELFQNVVSHVAERGAELSTQLPDLGDAAGETLLNEAIEIAQWLADCVSEQSGMGDDVVDSATDMALDAADLLQLMQLEDGGDAASEALTVLLQLKRDLQSQLAA